MIGCSCRAHITRPDEARTRRPHRPEETLSPREPAWKRRHESAVRYRASCPRSAGRSAAVAGSCFLTAVLLCCSSAYHTAACSPQQNCGISGQPRHYLGSSTFTHARARSPAHDTSSVFTQLQSCHVCLGKSEPVVKTNRHYKYGDVVLRFGLNSNGFNILQN